MKDQSGVYKINRYDSRYIGEIGRKFIWRKPHVIQQKRMIRNCLENNVTWAALQQSKRAEIQNNSILRFMNLNKRMIMDFSNFLKIFSIGTCKLQIISIILFLIDNSLS